MARVGWDDFRDFIRLSNSVKIGETEIEIGKAWEISDFGPPKEYRNEINTVWSFPDRGRWATHVGNYPGNWSPYVPRNLIQRYTEPQETVLDQMCGSGTTLVECKLLGRNAVGVDVNRDAIMVTMDRLNFRFTTVDMSDKAKINTYVGDATNLDSIPDESMDFVVTHPPYANIISYSRGTEGDLSTCRDLHHFLDGMHRVADESYRVLKPGRHCAILMGDTRKRKHFVPLSFRVLEQFLDVGFLLREDIIKIQWKTKKTREFWTGRKLDFYKIAHEHLFIFRKAIGDEERKLLRLSSKWW